MRIVEKFLLIILLSGLIVLGGGVYYAHYCIANMWPTSFTGPAHVHAEDTQYTCGMHPMIITDEPGLCPICNMDLTPLKEETVGGSSAGGERKIKYWVAPMDPTYIRDEPGKSPMGMDLVPVYEDQATGGSIISVDPVTVQNMGVRTEPVERRDLSRTIRTVGLVGYEEPTQYTVNSKIDGWVEKLYVAETGARVKKGQPLIEIYSPELVSAQQEYLLALQSSEKLAKSSIRSIADGAQRLLDASRRRLKLWDISDRQIAALEKNRKPSKTLTLHAPYSGIVTMKTATEGMFAKAGMMLFEMADISRVWVYADIYEYELPWLKVGQQATVHLPYAHDKHIYGRISTIYPYVEPKTRTVKARIDLDNSDLQLRPDMYVNVAIQSETVRQVLTVPVEAVLNSGQDQTVFIALAGGKFEPRRVKTGLQDKDGMIEVRQGLFDGEEVVVSAQFMLDSESKLREAIRKMREPKKVEPKSEVDDMDDLFGDDDQGKKEDLNDLFK